MSFIRELANKQVTVLIGTNRSGKSCLLHGICRDRLHPKDVQQHGH